MFKILPLKINKTKFISFTILFFISILLALFTTSEHIQERGGLNYLLNRQISRHNNLIKGIAGNPWQYRVLVPYIIEIFFQVFEYLKISSRHYIPYTFIFFRVLIDSLIFICAYIYYRKFGLSSISALIGMALLAWSVSYSHYESDLSFNTYIEVVFYLLAGICILKEKIIWIIPITLFAVLNRESSGLIPILVLIFVVFSSSKINYKEYITISISSLILYFCIFIGLRLFFGGRELMLPDGGVYPGFELMFHNLFRIVTWRELLATLNIIPFVAILGYATWPQNLKRFFWVIIPVWLIVHLFGAIMAEARLFLVPQAMVFIPGTLFYLTNFKNEKVRSLLP